MIEGIKNFFKHLLYGQIVITGGLFIFIATLIISGYIPNEEQIPDWFTKSNLNFLSGLELALGFIIPFALFMFASLIISFLLIKPFSAFINKKWQLLYFIITAGLLIPFGVLISVFGIGYYVSLDKYTGLTAISLGIIYATLIFPRLARSNFGKN